MREIRIRVVPRAKKRMIREETDGLKVYVTAPAVDGKANKALTESLAEYLNVKKNRIEIVHGLTSRDKVVQIR